MYFSVCAHLYVIKIDQLIVTVLMQENIVLLSEFRDFNFSNLLCLYQVTENFVFISNDALFQLFISDLPHVVVLIFLINFETFIREHNGRRSSWGSATRQYSIIAKWSVTF